MCTPRMRMRTHIRARARVGAHVAPSTKPLQRYNLSLYSLHNNNNLLKNNNNNNVTLPVIFALRRVTPKTINFGSSQRFCAACLAKNPRAGIAKSTNSRVRPGRPTPQPSEADPSSPASAFFKPATGRLGPRWLVFYNTNPPAPWWARGFGGWGGKNSTPPPPFPRHTRQPHPMPSRRQPSAVVSHPSPLDTSPPNTTRNAHNTHARGAAAPFNPFQRL